MQKTAPNKRDLSGENAVRMNIALRYPIASLDTTRMLHLLTVWHRSLVRNLDCPVMGEDDEK